MAEFSAARSLSSHTSDEDEDLQPKDDETQRTPPFPTGDDTIILSSPASAARPPRRSSRTPTPASDAALLSPRSASSGRKPRGRPPGSKNKPKPPVYITKEAEPSIKTQQLEIPAGCDIVDMVQRFSSKRRVGVHIFSGSGSVSNFTLQHPAVTLSGAFNLLSLSGTFMGPSVCSSSPSSERASSSFSSGGSSPWLAIFVGGSAGEVYGGMVAGKVLAASDVVLNVNTFANYEFHRVEPAEFEDDEEEVGSREGPAVKQEGCSVSAGAGGSRTPASFAVPADHLNWAPPPASTTRPMNHRF